MISITCILGRRALGYETIRLNVERPKCMQEIVCGCSGKASVENTRSCRCECPVLMRLLRTKDNGWHIAENRKSHSHSLSPNFVETIHWPSHKSIDVYNKDLIKQLRQNNVNLAKLYNIVGSFFGLLENVPFTRSYLGRWKMYRLQRGLYGVCVGR